jgi:tRNA(Ile)-lysidine synthetase-like protein
MADEELEKIRVKSLPDSMTISSAALLEIDRRIRYRIYRIALGRLGIKKPKSKERILSIDRLLICGRKGKEIELGNGAVVSLLHGGLKFLMRKKSGATIEPLLLEVPMIMKTCAGSLSIMQRRDGESATADLIDANRLDKGLLVRNRKAGDYLFSKKSGHKKSLKKFLIDKKIDADIRDFLPMIADGSEILYVPGVYIADRIEATQTSEIIAEIEWIDANC